MFDMEKVGKNIANARKNADMTQMELADRMGVSFQAVSNWERGSSMPDIAKLPELAQTLGITVDAMLGSKNGAIGKVIGGGLAESIRTEEVSMEAVAEIAPLMKPGQVEDVIRSGGDFGRDRFDSVLPLLPFATEDCIRDLARRYPEHLTDLVPYMSEDDVGDVVLTRINTDGFDTVSAFFPHMSYPSLRTVAEQYPDRLKEIAPFMAEDDLYEIVLKTIKTGDTEKAMDLVPFLAEENVAALAEQYPEHIGQFAPFMYEDDMNRFIRKLLNKNG